MKNSKRVLAISSFAMAMAIAGPVVAQDVGWYVGGSLGQSDVDIDCAGATSCDTKDTAWKIFAGYQFSRNIAVEFGYADLGEATASGPVPGFGTVAVGFEATVFELVGVGSLPLADRFSLYGKIGAYRADTEVSASSASFSGSTSDSNFDVTLGFGARFDFTRNIGVRAEWQRYLDVGSDDVGGKTDVDVLSVGIVFKF